MAEFFNEKGMSLLEVMVTMFMVALISSSLMGGFIISHQMIKQAGLETRASSFAYQILEDLRARPAEDWEVNAAETEKSTHSFFFSSDANDGVDLQATVCFDENQYFHSLYNVRVLVTWEDRGRSHTLEMVTVLNPALRGATI